MSYPPPAALIPPDAGLGRPALPPIVEKDAIKCPSGALVPVGSVDVSILSRLVGGPVGVAPPLPFPPGSAEELPARWVQWVASSAGRRNPVADRKGKHAAGNQPADVWFLAGTFGGRAVRRCEVPVGRPLFVPVFSMWTRGLRPPVPQPDLVEASLVVDKEPVEPEFVGTLEPFTVTGVWRNPVTGTPRPTEMNVWGLWKRLEPLPPGAHVIALTSRFGRFFNLDVRYDLHIRQLDQ